MANNKSSIHTPEFQNKNREVQTDNERLVGTGTHHQVGKDKANRSPSNPKIKKPQLSSSVERQRSCKGELSSLTHA